MVFKCKIWKKLKEIKSNLSDQDLEILLYTGKWKQLLKQEVLCIGVDKKVKKEIDKYKQQVKNTLLEGYEKKYDVKLSIKEVYILDTLFYYFPQIKEEKEKVKNLVFSIQKLTEINIWYFNYIFFLLKNEKIDDIELIVNFLVNFFSLFGEVSEINTNLFLNIYSYSIVGFFLLFKWLKSWVDFDFLKEFLKDYFENKNYNLFNNLLILLKNNIEVEKILYCYPYISKFLKKERLIVDSDLVSNEDDIDIYVEQIFGLKLKEVEEVIFVIFALQKLWISLPYFDVKEFSEIKNFVENVKNILSKLDIDINKFSNVNNKYIVTEEEMKVLVEEWDNVIDDMFLSDNNNKNKWFSENNIKTAQRIIDFLIKTNLIFNWKIDIKTKNDLEMLWILIDIYNILDDSLKDKYVKNLIKILRYFTKFKSDYYLLINNLNHGFKTNIVNLIRNIIE